MEEFGLDDYETWLDEQLDEQLMALERRAAFRKLGVPCNPGYTFMLPWGTSADDILMEDYDMDFDLDLVEMLINEKIRQMILTVREYRKLGFDFLPFGPNNVILDWGSSTVPEWYEEEIAGTATETARSDHKHNMGDQSI